MPYFISWDISWRICCGGNRRMVTNINSSPWFFRTVLFNLKDNNLNLFYFFQSIYFQKFICICWNFWICIGQRIENWLKLEFAWIACGFCSWISDKSSKIQPFSNTHCMLWSHTQSRRGDLKLRTQYWLFYKYYYLQHIHCIQPFWFSFKSLTYFKKVDFAISNFAQLSFDCFSLILQENRAKF